MFIIVLNFGTDVSMSRRSVCAFGEGEREREREREIHLYFQPNSCNACPQSKLTFTHLTLNYTDCIAAISQFWRI